MIIATDLENTLWEGEGHDHRALTIYRYKEDGELSGIELCMYGTDGKFLGGIDELTIDDLKHIIGGMVLFIEKFEQEGQR